MKIGEIYKNKVNGEMVEIWNIEQDLIMYEPVNQKENENVHLILECTNKKTFKKMFVLDKKQSKKIEKKKEQPIFTITKRLKDCSIAHRLVNYNGRCANLHGHSYHVEIELKVAGQQENGISVDFNDFKEIDNFLQDNWDHAVLVNSSDKSLVNFLRVEKQKYFLLPSNPTAENMCIYLKDLVKNHFKDYNNIVDIKVRIWETETSICEL